MLLLERRVRGSRLQSEPRRRAVLDTSLRPLLFKRLEMGWLREAGSGFPHTGCLMRGDYVPRGSYLVDFFLVVLGCRLRGIN